MICKYCGQETEGKFCGNCGAILEAPEAPPQAPEAPQAAPEKKENIATGTVGAIIGAILGGASIVLLNQLGLVASISGFILAVCTLKGYELLGGKLGTAGLVISIVLMLITPYLADRICWAIAIVEAFSAEGVTFSMAFASVPEALSVGMIDTFEYYKDLGLLYLFALLGAFGTVRGFLGGKKR